MPYIKIDTLSREIEPGTAIEVDGGFNEDLPLQIRCVCGEHLVPEWRHGLLEYRHPRASVADCAAPSQFRVGVKELLESALCAVLDNVALEGRQSVDRVLRKWVSLVYVDFRNNKAAMHVQLSVLRPDAHL